MMVIGGDRTLARVPLFWYQERVNTCEGGARVEVAATQAFSTAPR
jgi:hypothetical protein